MRQPEHFEGAVGSLREFSRPRIFTFSVVAAEFVPASLPCRALASSATGLPLPVAQQWGLIFSFQIFGQVVVLIIVCQWPVARQWCLIFFSFQYLPVPHCRGTGSLSARR